MNRRVFVLSAFAAAGCATAPPQPSGPLAELEPLYAVQARPAGLTIQVASNGCTKKEDFAFYVERKPTGVTLAFARKRLDPCKSFAMGKTELVFSWTELGLSETQPTFVLNPVTAWTGPGS